MLGQVWIRLKFGYVKFELGQVSFQVRLRLGYFRVRLSFVLGQVRVKIKLGLDYVWVKLGFFKGQIKIKLELRQD